MDSFQTPIRGNRKPAEAKQVTIPPSPFLTRLGYGTGVAVYKLERSPVANRIRSPWAIKKLLKPQFIQNSDDFGERLKEEASVLRQLDHPNIVGFRAFITTKDNQECLAMEECNVSLGDMIEARCGSDLKAYPARDIMKVALDVAEALNYLHTQALLLHGDVKSYNVLVKGDFEICKLCDFGVTLPLNKRGEIDRDKAGEDAEYVGTQPWSAPEVFKYPQVITTKADMFSYGLVLWEMLSLSPPCMRDYGEDMLECSNLENSANSGSGEGTEFECEFGKRPDLPDQDFDDSYKYVLEIFHCCTEEELAKRPSAQDLIISIPEMNKDLGFN